MTIDEVDLENLKTANQVDNKDLLATKSIEDGIVPYRPIFTDFENLFDEIVEQKSSQESKIIDTKNSQKKNSSKKFTETINE